MGLRLFSALYRSVLHDASALDSCSGCRSFAPFLLSSVGIGRVVQLRAPRWHRARPLLGRGSRVGPPGGSSSGPAALEHGRTPLHGRLIRLSCASPSSATALAEPAFGAAGLESGEDGLQPVLEVHIRVSAGQLGRLLNNVPISVGIRPGDSDEALTLGFRARRPADGAATRRSSRFRPTRHSAVAHERHVTRAHRWAVEVVVGDSVIPPLTVVVVDEVAVAVVVDGSAGGDPRGAVS